MQGVEIKGRVKPRQAEETEISAIDGQAKHKIRNKTEYQNDKCSKQKT